MKDIAFTLNRLRQAHSSAHREALIAEVVEQVAEFIQQPNQGLIFRFTTHVTDGVVTEISHIGTIIALTIDGSPLSFNPDDLLDIEPVLIEDQNN